MNLSCRGSRIIRDTVQAELILLLIYARLAK
jgi:hypothetical protein